MSRHYAGWALFTLAWAILFVIHMSNTVAYATECPAGTAKVPYGGPDETGYHWIYQPNQPAAYVYVLTSDGTTLGPFPFGQYGPYGTGQWYVCYTDNVEPFRHLATPPTTTTTTTAPTTTTTIAPKRHTPKPPKPTVARYGNTRNIAI